MANWDSYRHDLDTLRSELENLFKKKKEIEAKNDVMRSIQIAEKEEDQQPMKPTTEVQLWLSSVEAVETEVDELIKQASEEIDRLHPGSFSSRTFNMSSSYEFKDMVADKLQAVTNLINEGAVLLADEGALEVSVPETIPEDEADDQWPIVGMESIINEVWRCLKKEDEEGGGRGDEEEEEEEEEGGEGGDDDDDEEEEEEEEEGGGGGDDDDDDDEEEEEEEDVGIIGVYGMGGVGKTTLLKQIYKKLLQMKNDFDVVIWVVVSRDLQLDKIQQQIGKKIGLFDNKVWKHKNFEDKASDIFKILEEKKFVLLMDDLWERVDLTKVGVPLPSPENSSKIVFTTRSLQICSLMEADRQFKVTCLSNDDAWELFQALVGDETLQSHPEVLKLARGVSRWCYGMPLAVVSFGRAMVSKKTPQEWSDALKVLRRSMTSYSGSDDLLKKDIRDNLKLSYDNLQNDMFKSCFLYCCLFPRELEIKKGDLIDYWIGEGFLDERLGAVQSQGHYIIDVFLSVCLLEQSGKDDSSVKMHYWIHDMSLWIASKIETEEGNFFFCPDTYNFNLAKATRISLRIDKVMEMLTDPPRCPLLQTLFLICNGSDVISEDHFFNVMPSLKVLNLSSNYWFTKFPRGILKLISLQHLDLSGTKIQELPTELRVLKILKCLNFENTRSLCTIPQQLISEFSMLHVLRLWECGFMLQPNEDSVVCNDAQLLIEELLYLKNLSMLSITLNNSYALQRLLSSNRLQSCIQSLCLRDLSNPKSIKVPLTDLKHLNTLEISNCKYLGELEVDFVGEAQAQDVGESPSSFYFLHEVIISNCRKLRELTWLILAPNLKHLRISDCEEMEEIINVGKLSKRPELMGNVTPFSKLKFLTLTNLPKLRSIYWTDLPFPDLKKPNITDCPMLQVPPRLQRVTSANLQVGNALLGGLIQLLFDRYVPRDSPLVREHEVLAELSNWGDMLKTIQSALGDAEEKQWTKQTVKMWLDHLQDFAYDLEDMLDELNTEFLRRSLKEKSQTIVKYKFGDMTQRLKELCDRTSLLGLEETTLTAVWRRPSSASLPTESAIFGREGDICKILEMMSSAANFRVISIVGMAGVGKTTLAQQVYNHTTGVTDFDRRAWVCVSNDFDVFRISKEILESITHSICNLKDLNEVHVQLQLAVAGRRFLLVLDDVWSKNYDLWETLTSPFVTGAPGSRIIVTTRWTDVALTVGGLRDCYNLNLLSDDDCWSVFQMHVFENRNIDAHQNLDSVREKVVQKCGGLPLAAKTLGGILRSKHRDDEWEDILNCRIWDLPEDTNILTVLKLSYYHLPSHLKRCFAYCAILPKNYEFEEEELVLLWMAEGLILPSVDNKQLEDIGGEYFRNLLSRSIFQQSRYDASKFAMHNLFNELAQCVSGETCFRLEDKLGANQLKRLQRARHSSYISSNFDGKNKFDVFYQVIDHLRTFLPILTHNRDSDDCNYICYEVIKLLPKFKKLRVLSLRKYYIMKLPKSIGELRYLRYLNLADTEIASLPDSIKDLFNLQVLILRNCYRLKLPCEVGTLINLRHLDIHRDIEGTRNRRERPNNPITEMPSGIQELKYLETLSNFIVGKKGSGSPLKDLKNLMFLHGELHISQLENVNPQELREAILSDKKDLEELILEWGIVFDNSRNDDKEKDVLDMLRPHANLKKLAINNYGGSAFPAWIEDPSFSNMVVLRLEGCENCTSLPSLGVLSKLKELTISGMKKLTTIDSGFYGNRLLELSIVNCRQLSGSLPAHLPSLRKLVILQCEKLEVSISSIPKLCELEIDDRIKMVYTDGADSLSPNSIDLSLFSELGNWSGRAVHKLKELKIKCPALVSIPEAQFLSSLRELEITDCRKIESLQEVMEQSTRLDRLVIKGCDDLTSVAEGQLPSSLKTLDISSCGKLLCLFGNINGSLLEYLVVSKCPVLGSLSSTGQLPKALHRLEIEHCEMLTTIGQLPETLKRLVIKHLDSLSSAGQLPASLEHLSIGDCSKLTSLSSIGDLPASLQHLEIESCLELTSLSSTGHLPASLQHLQIASCSKLTSLSSGQLLPATLKYLNISSCGISSIADGLQKLYSLQELHILNLTSLSSFPQQGFPINLTSLSIISNQDQVMQTLMQQLHKLTSLRNLLIDGCQNADSFPQKGMEMMLPFSLTRLTLANFSKLIRLSPEGFKNLASLEYLSITSCRELKYFLEKDLPSSLLELHISDCPSLTDLCGKKGKYQPNISSLTNLCGNKRKYPPYISNIPCVKIDGKYIHEPPPVDPINEEKGDSTSRRL